MRYLIKLYEDFRRAVELSQRSGKKGFSLIELLVVIAIIAILAAIAIPQYNRYKIEAQISNTQNMIKDDTGYALDLATSMPSGHVEVYTATSSDASAAQNCTASSSCYLIVKDLAGTNLPNKYQKINIPYWVRKFFVDYKIFGKTFSDDSISYLLTEYALNSTTYIGCKYYPSNDTMVDYGTDNGTEYKCYLQ